VTRAQVVGLAGADDRCQCPHWGYLLKGSFRVTYLDGPDEIQG
jgi:hypothetical protein